MGTKDDPPLPLSVKKHKHESAAVEGHVSKQVRTDTAGYVHVQNGTHMPVRADIEKTQRDLEHLERGPLAMS